MKLPTEFENCIMQGYKENLSLHKCNYYIKQAVSSLQKYIIANVENQKLIISSTNMIEKLKRISKRNNPNITINIAKIYLGLLMDESHYNVLSNNINDLITLSNEIIIIVDLVQSLNFSFLLKQKLISFLSFLISNDKIIPNQEQKQTISNLISNLPFVFFSQSYLQFNNKINDDIINNFSSIQQLFITSSSLNEQFDMLSKFPLTFQLNEQMAYEFGKFLLVFIFNFNYIVDCTIDSNNKTSLYLLIDATKLPMSYTQSDSYNNISYDFINNKKFSLYNNIKGLQLAYVNKNNEIVKIVMNYLKEVNEKFKNDYNIQINAFLLLKRIYANYIEFSGYKNANEIKEQIINDINKYIINIFVNLYKIKNIKDTNIDKNLFNEVDNFMIYLITKNKIEKLKEILIENGIEIPPLIEIDESNVLYETLYLTKINLSIGYENVITIDAGNSYSLYLNVTEKNTLIYISFSVDKSDISCVLSKYNSKRDQGEFIEMFNIEKGKCDDIPINLLLFARTSGLYKIEFDNSYSWITPKVLKYKSILMKAIESIPIIDSIVGDVGNRVDSSSISSISSYSEEGKRSSELEVFSKRRKIFVYYENVHYTFDADEIEKDINAYETNDNDINSNTITLLLHKTNCYQFIPKKDKTFSLSYTVDTLSNNNNKEEYQMASRFFIERLVDKMISQFNGKNCPINLNIFSINQYFMDKNSNARSEMETFSTSTTNYNPTDKIINCIKKIGTYPATLLSVYSNLTFNCFNLVDQELIYHLYLCKVKSIELSNCVLFIHFNESGAQIAMFNEGGLFNLIKGFKYDSSKDIEGNREMIELFTAKANDSLDGIDFAMCFTNIEEERKNEFVNKIKINLSKLKEINIFVYGNEFVYEVLTYCNIIHSEKNKSIFNNEDKKS